MLQVIQGKLDELDTTKSGILAHLALWSPERLNTPSEAGKWSPGQVLFHVITTEQFVVISLKRALRDVAVLAVTGEVNERKASILTAALRSERKFVAPPAAATVPVEVTAEALQVKWQKVRNELAAAAGAITESTAQLAVFDHPYAGPLNTPQALSFLLEHLLHHRRQILP